MNIRNIGFLLFASLLLGFSVSNASAGDELKTAAFKKFQQAVVRALPVESNVVRVAILDLEGDNGTVRDALTSAITEKTTYKVMERKDLDKILEEQGLQLKDIMDEKTRVQPGRIKGVQGILMGKVLENKAGFLSYTLRVNLKLDDVEKGEIVLSKDFNASVVSPFLTWLIVGVLMVIAITILLIFIKKRRVTVIEKTVQTELRERIDLSKDLGKAVTSISQARSKLMDQGRTNEAFWVKEAERELLLLRDQVSNAARGSADLREKKEFKEVLEFDKKFKEIFEGLGKSADTIFDHVSGGGGNLERDIEGFRREIKNAANEFKGRNF